MDNSLKLLSTTALIILLSGCAHLGSSPSKNSADLPYVSPPNTTNKMAMRIYEMLPVYSNAAKLNWQPIQAETPMKQTFFYSAVPTIRQRLIALQDMPPEAKPSTSAYYSAAITEGVKQFQSENGLKVTGIIDQATLDSLNIPPIQRYRELVQSMNEWAKLPQDASSRYIQVNIPTYEMHVEQGGQDVLHMRVIVGRPERPTPTLSSTVTTIQFNPSWNVPKTILEKDVIPGMQANPNYMHDHYDMKIYATWDKDSAEIDPSTINWQTANSSNFRYRVTAPPSAVNPLGRVKFIFANTYDVYMHDTPEKSLFALNDRARSSGCIRLENPMALVAYFYNDNSDLNEQLVAQYLSTYQTKYIALKHPIPVYVTYILASVDQQGHAHFARDIYHQG